MLEGIAGNVSLILKKRDIDQLSRTVKLICFKSSIATIVVQMKTATD